MDKFEAAIFDMDGTLLDSMPCWLNCAEKYLLSQGIEPEKALSEKLFTFTMMEGASYLKTRYALSASEKEIISGVNSVISNAYAREIQFKEGAEAFLQKLRNQGIKTALFTNTDRELFTPALKRLDAEKYFDFIFTTGEIMHSKSESKAFLKVCDALGAGKENTWVFEDALYAVRSAAKTGIKTCALYDESSEKDEAEIRKSSTVYYRNFKEAAKYFFAD